MRHITYTILNREHRHKAGVYVMIIGDHFYVGITNNFLRRYIQHMTDQRNAMYDNLEGKIPRNEGAAGKALADDPRIRNVYFQIVELCDCPTERQRLEKLWIKAFKNAGYSRLLLNQTNTLV